MNWKLISPTFFLLAFNINQSQAQDFSYKYIEASYLQGETDSYGDDTEAGGAGIKISWDFDGLVMQAGRSEGEFDRILGIDPNDFGIDIDLKETSFFIGGSGPILENMSVLSGLTYSKVEIDSNIIDLSADVWSLGADFRYRIIPMLELTFGVHYIYADYDYFNENDFSYSAGLRFQPLEMISVGVTYIGYKDANVDSYKADIRYQF